MAKRTYHNLTSHYNGYFNAKELYKKSVSNLEDGYQDNYNQILELYPYVATDQEKSVEDDLETAIQKVSVVVKLHRKGDWTDDCYFLLGQCRYIQKDYEGAQEAFEYLSGEYNLKALEKKKQGNKKKKKKKKSSKKKKGEEKPEKYPFEKRPAYEDGYIWLAKTYIERQRYDDAELIISTMKNDEKTHKDMADEIAETLAYSALKQEDYESAIVHLQEAFDISKSRKKKVRYAYIIAQIHQNAGRGDEAFTYFEKVLKNGPKYDMEFNARLSMITNAWIAGKESSESIIKKLNKMLKDSKNKEYKDRIYYTMAQVHLKENNKNAAIASLRKSLNYNSNNKAQKAESYLLLGDLYYDAEEYVNAKLYFDSTLVSLNTTDDRIDRVKSMSDNLIEIAENIQIIELQDSLLAINDLSPEARRKLAARLLKEKEAAKAASKNASSKPSSSTAGITNSLGASKSSFFAYSDRSLKRGKKNFDRRWGARALEDNWRRSNKKGGSAITEESSPEEIAENLSEKEIEDIFKDVPSTPSEIATANDKIMKAMFKLGALFRNKIQNNAKSVETLEELVSRYPNTPDKLEAYYNLYLAHTDLGNKPRAKYYYDKIVKEFPNTTYARVLKDPNFLNEANAKEKEVVAYYDATYDLFKKEQYEKAFSRIQSVDQKFGKSNKMKPKFALLGAMCTGSMKGKDDYIKALKEVVAKYPKTDEEKRAKEILRYLGGGKITSTPPKGDGKGKEEGDKKNDGKPKADNGVFKMDDNKSHYFIASLKSGDDLKDAKEVVNTYNHDNFATKAYRANSIYLQSGNKTPLIVVRRFRNKADAMFYYNKVSAEKDSFLGSGVEAEMFVIAQSNYREILKMKSVESYIGFFKENYLK